MAHHAHRRFIQYISQPLSAAVTDVAFPFMLAGLASDDRISGQFLELLRVIETLNIPDLRYKSDHSL